MEKFGKFQFEPISPGSKSGRVHVGTTAEMVETDSEWIWARDMKNYGCRQGEPVHPIYRKKIFKSWLDLGWVCEAPKPPEQLAFISFESNEIVQAE